MDKFLVGGAVRDELLGFPVTERDWVLVGASPDDLLKEGYRSVGKDFPVFLHPETHEEYALARTERKTGPGYYGFDVHAGSDVTLDQDLFRRDLTINAMARNSDGEIIDPYNGRRDLELRLLRHVSPAFPEDPVRILRVARFAARYAHVGFQVADETMALMQAMVASGEVEALVAERVWAEFVRAMGERSPAVFIDVLRECDASAVLFPEIERLFGVEGLAGNGRRVDIGQLALECLRRSVKWNLPVPVRFALLTGDLGKPLTSRESWPDHSGHQQLGVPALNGFCERLKVPREYKQTAVSFMRHHEVCDGISGLGGEDRLILLKELGALRKSYNPEPFLQACACSYSVCRGSGVDEYPQADILRGCRKAALGITPRSLIEQGVKGAAIGEALWQLQVDAIESSPARESSGDPK